jgi:hypothetical protein
MRATLDQGEASRRPFFKLKKAEPSNTRSPLVLVNVGPGVALDVWWKFLDPKIKHPNHFSIGAVGVGMAMGLPIQMDYKLQINTFGPDGIRIEYKDTSGKGYWTKISMSEQKYFVIDTGEL